MLVLRFDFPTLLLERKVTSACWRFPFPTFPFLTGHIYIQQYFIAFLYWLVSNMPDKLDRLVFYHPQGWTLFQPNSAIYCIISSGLTLCLLDPFAASIRPLPQRLNSVFEPSCCIVSYHHDIIKTMISFKLIFLDRPCLYSTAPLKESVSLFTAASNESFNSIQ